MESKYRYNSRKVNTEIKKWIKDFNGKTDVIYCIDTDHIDNDAQRQKEFNEIKRYCNEKNYKLIWFCLDIEDVYLGQQINDTEKVQKAKWFSLNGGVSIVDAQHLVANELNRHKSNILLILDQLLERK